jgi:hypothetical protein
MLLLGEVEHGLHFAFLYDMFVGEGASFFEEYTKASKELGEYVAR